MSSSDGTSKCFPGGLATTGSKHQGLNAGRFESPSRAGPVTFLADKGALVSHGQNGSIKAIMLFNTQGVAMKPGKALNELIAREVMKMRQHGDYAHLWTMTDHTGRPFTALPKFSENIRDAANMADHIGMEYAVNGADFIFVKDGRTLKYTPSAPDLLPFYMCVAALKFTVKPLTIDEALSKPDE